MSTINVTLADEPNNVSVGVKLKEGGTLTMAFYCRDPAHLKRALHWLCMASPEELKMFGLTAEDFEVPA